MKFSNTDTTTGIANPSRSLDQRRGAAHFQPFNGSDSMISVSRSLDEWKTAGRREAILTVRTGTDSVSTRTITIPWEGNS
ncbi:MAG: hypothetical protein ACXVJO_17805 [Thermoanaerobaculia bacterium]